MWLLWTALAVAGVPDAVVTSFEVTANNIDDIVLSSDGSLVAFTASTGELHTLSVETWALTSLDICGSKSVSGIALVDADSDGNQTIYVGCTSGAVRVVDYSLLDGPVEAEGDAEDTAVDEDTGDGVTGSSTMSVGTTVHGLWWDEDEGLLYVYGDDDNDDPALMSLDPNEGVPEEIAALTRGSLQEGLFDGSVLYMSHGGDDVTVFTPASGTVSLSYTTSVIDAGDLCWSPYGVFAVDTDGYVAEYRTTYTGYTVVLTEDDVTACAVEDSTSADWGLLARGDEVDVRTLSGSTWSNSADDTLEVSSPVVDGIVHPDGWSLLGTEDGTIEVLTDKPWVSEVAASPDTITQGSEVTLSFTVDSDVDYEVVLNGDRSGDGTVLAQGSASSGDTVEETVEVDDDWAEGTNVLYVFATDDDDQVGHGAAVLETDNPPERVKLTSDAVGFGDGTLKLTFSGNDDEDLDHYEIYVTTTEFSASDYSEGGPAFDGDDALDTPIELDGEPGEEVSTWISPLTNGVTYYIAVRAIDDGGLEGKMSRVVSGTPEQTWSVSQLAGDEGGFSCASTSSGGVLGAIFGLVALVGLRRRTAMAGTLVLAALAVAPEAHAQDQTPAWGNVELRYGPIFIQDSLIKDVYGESGHAMLQMEFGVQVFRFLEIDMGTGFYQDLAYNITEDGDVSSERNMLTFIPLTAQAALRLHIWDEQPLVPYGIIGAGIYPWWEEWEISSGTRDSTVGTKVGWHFGAGLNILLDAFGPKRASLLEAQTGVNDAWLTVEWRRQLVGKEGELKFDADALTFGLKIDF